MKQIKLAVVAVLVLAANGAYAEFPADAELNNGIGASEAYAQMQSRRDVAPSEVWGVGKRAVPTPHDPFPFGGGVIDD